MSRAFISTPRVGLVTVVILAGFGALLARLYFLHVVERDQLVSAADKSRQSFDIIHARRGNIVDQRGNVLATTRTVIEVGVDPRAVKPQDFVHVPELARLLGLTPEQVQAFFTDKLREVQTADGVITVPNGWVKICDAVEEPVYEQIKALGIKALYGNRKFERVYPGNELAAHLLGFMDREGKPATGVENYMDFYLRGQDGWREGERDGHRQELAQFRSREVPSTDGLNVELTVDLMLQDYAEQEVKKLVADYQPRAATIIIGDPSTGDILAMANYPTFDPNHYWDYPLENLRNRAVSATFEPGSTFKIVTASAAINEGLVKPEDRFDCSKAEVEYRGHMLSLPADHEVFGMLTVSEIVSHSSNRGAANLGMLLGEQKLHDYAQAFGFGEKSGFGFGGEEPGNLKPVRLWDGLTITRMPMGHAISATALQVHDSMSVVANQGVLMEPHLVRRVFDSQGRTVVSFPPVPKRRVISTHTAEQLNEMLCNVVGPEGTAVRAKLQDITVAGKTGTAQELDATGHYSNQHYLSSFSGYFPAERPRLVMTVVVDDAHFHGTAYGGLVAAPAFHDVAEKAVQYLGIQPATGRNNLLAMKGDTLDWFR